MSKKRYRLLILVLGALTALAPFSIDMYLPGFPAIATYFGVSTARVTLSLSSFFLGIATGQIAYGPFLDRYGRKPPLYVGMGVYLAATIGCCFAPSIEALVALRFMQAIGGCAAGVVAMAMVRDLFLVADNARIFSLLILVLGMSPMVAPTVGSFIAEAAGWQAIFATLAALAVIILIAVYTVLPESRPPDASYRLQARPILFGFWQIIRVPQFLTYAIGGGMALAGLFAYIAASPTVFMEGYGVSNRTYGWIFAAITLGFVGFSQLNRLLAKYFRAEAIVLGAIIGIATVSLVLLIGLECGWLGMAGTASLLFLCLGAIGIVNPNAAALSMAPFEKNGGSAASLYGAIQWGIAGLSGIGVSLFNSHSAMPLAGIMVGASILSLFAVLVGSTAIRHQAAAAGRELRVPQ